MWRSSHQEVVDVECQQSTTLSVDAVHARVALLAEVHEECDALGEPVESCARKAAHGLPHTQARVAHRLNGLLVNSGCFPQPRREPKVSRGPVQVCGQVSAVYVANLDGSTLEGGYREDEPRRTKADGLPV